MKILVLGATGFVGRHVVQTIQRLKPAAEMFEASFTLGTDFREKAEIFNLFESIKPDYVINCAAYVGGIQYGYIHPAEIFCNNMQMILNIFEACKTFGVKRLVQPISNCAYPAGETFFREENFWDGPLHESVMVYGMTRKMMWTGAWAYSKQYGLDTLSLIVSNMYGPGDHFDEVRSHALGALIKKIVDAKSEGNREVTIWGTGQPVREWLYVKDGAEALVRGIDAKKSLDIVNVGSGEGISIKDLAELIKDVVGWDGEFVYDTSKPDGAAHKTVDGTRGEYLLGWRPSTTLRECIKETVESYLQSGRR